MARIDSLGEPFQYPVPEKKKTVAAERHKRREFSNLVESAAEGGELTPEDFDEADGRRSVEELLDAVFSSGTPEKGSHHGSNQGLPPAGEGVREVRGGAQHQRGGDDLRGEHPEAQEVHHGEGDRREAGGARRLRAGGPEEQIAILAQIDEINGLLVDLVS